MSASERSPAGGPSELIAASKTSVPPQADIYGAQLSRIETILDRIVGNLTPLVGAR